MFHRRRRPPWWALPLPFIGVLMGLFYSEKYTGHLTGAIRLESLFKQGMQLYRKYAGK